MNDRYLFRAKTCNGVWVQGLLAHKDNKYYISNKSGMPFAYEVRQDTICACTGLKDKNGKLIWENDIMIGHLDDIFPEDATYVRVMWHNNGFCTHQDGYDDYKPLDEFDQNNFEVCGNTVDNPELLEVEE